MQSPRTGVAQRAAVLSGGSGHDPAPPGCGRRPGGAGSLARSIGGHPSRHGSPPSRGAREPALTATRRTGGGLNECCTDRFRERPSLPTGALGRPQDSSLPRGGRPAPRRQQPGPCSSSRHTGPAPAAHQYRRYAAQEPVRGTRAGVWHKSRCAAQEPVSGTGAGVRLKAPVRAARSPEQPSGTTGNSGFPPQDAPDQRPPPTQHSAPSTEHRAPSTEHRAPSTEHRQEQARHRHRPPTTGHEPPGPRPSTTAPPHHRLTDSPTHRLTDSPTHRLTDHQTPGQAAPPTHRPSAPSTIRPRGRPTHRRGHPPNRPAERPTRHPDHSTHTHRITHTAPPPAARRRNAPLCRPTPAPSRPTRSPHPPTGRPALPRAPPPSARSGPGTRYGLSRSRNGGGQPPPRPRHCPRSWR